MNNSAWNESSDVAAMLAFVRDAISPRRMRLFAVACARLVWHLLTGEQSRRAVEAAERYADGGATKNEMRNWFQLAPVDRESSKDFGFIDLAWMCCGTYDGHTAVTDFFSNSHPTNRDADFADALRCLVNPYFRPAHDDAETPAWRSRDVLALARAAYGERAVPDLTCPDCGGKGRTLAVRSKSFVVRTACSRCRGKGVLRTRSEVVRLRTEESIHGGCCDYFADRSGCGCLADAAPDADGRLCPARLAVLADALEEGGAEEEAVAHLRGRGPHWRGMWSLDYALGLE